MTAPKDNDELRHLLEGLADKVGSTTTRDYEWKNGLWEGLSIDHVVAIDEAEAAIMHLISTHVMRARRGFADQLKLAMIDGKASHSVSRINEIIDQELAAAENFDHLKSQRKGASHG